MVLGIEAVSNDEAFLGLLINLFPSSSTLVMFPLLYVLVYFIATSVLASSIVDVTL